MTATLGAGEFSPGFDAMEISSRPECQRGDGVVSQR
jgi:hypothetical protein